MYAWCHQAFYVKGPDHVDDDGEEKESLNSHTPPPQKNPQTSSELNLKVLTPLFRVWY